MNKILAKTITLLSIVASASVFAGTQDGYTIKITVKGFKEGSTCILAN